MIPRECKRLAEVDSPIAEASRHAAREKSIRHLKRINLPAVVGQTAPSVGQGDALGVVASRPMRRLAVDNGAVKSP